MGSQNILPLSAFRKSHSCVSIAWGVEGKWGMAADCPCKAYRSKDVTTQKNPGAYHVTNFCLLACFFVLFQRQLVFLCAPGQLQSSCLRLLSAGITGEAHHSQLQKNLGNGIKILVPCLLFFLKAVCVCVFFYLSLPVFIHHQIMRACRSQSKTSRSRFPHSMYILGVELGSSDLCTKPFYQILSLLNNGPHLNNFKSPLK